LNTNHIDSSRLTIYNFCSYSGLFTTVDKEESRRARPE
jgi:hypothetical protein